MVMFSEFVACSAIAMTRYVYKSTHRSRGLAIRKVRIRKLQCNMKDSTGNVGNGGEENLNVLLFFQATVLICFHGMSLLP